MFLTHNQTTNFRLDENGKKVIETGRNLWEKEKLLVKSNFSFSLIVFKRLVSQGSQKVSLCGNGLNTFFNVLAILQQPVYLSMFFSSSFHQYST